MSTLVPQARRAAVALAASVSMFFLFAAVAQASTTAELRVLTPNGVLDPGTNYVIEEPITVATSPGADCFGPPGGSGAEYELATPNALGLLATGSLDNRKLKPLGLTDQFGFGLGLCDIGKAEAEANSFWYLKANGEEATVGIDQLPVKDGDEVVLYLSPTTFPDPNPAELALDSPARVTPGEEFEVEVTQSSCTTDQTTFETSCGSGPADGVSVRGGVKPVTTGADGVATVTARSSASMRLVGTRGSDIATKRLELCIDPDLDLCPKAFGERFVGASSADRLKGGRGSDEISGARGDDKIDIRSGGSDQVDCGAGTDRVTVKRSDGDDEISRNCERIQKR
jgi:hypothetical protein